MGRPLSHQILQVLGLSALVFALCAWPAWAWGASDGLVALGLAAAICFLGAAAGRVAGEMTRRLDDSDTAAPRAVQAAIGVRMMATLVLSLPVFLLEPVPLFAFVVWLAANYLLHLALEVFVSLRHLGQNARPSPEGPAPGTTDLPNSPTDLSNSPTATPLPDAASSGGASGQGAQE